MFRDPLVVLRPYPAATSERAVTRAVQVAALVSDRVSAFTCGGVQYVPRRILGNLAIDVSGMISEEKRKCAADVQRLLSMFRQGVAKNALVLGDQIAELHPATDIPGVLINYVRLFDLTIVPLLEEDRRVHSDARWQVEDVILGSGHPTIMVPQASDSSKPVKLDRILVAWDWTRTAARAIADAMPLLRVAADVRLLTVRGEKPIMFERPGDALARHLRLQGTRVAVHEVDAAGRAIGEVLADEARVHGSDLLVMGAYGRSRMIELILGGATQAMLARPPTALFMSH